MVDSLYLIRHGTTAWSLTGQHTSHTDLPLTADGERQAHQLGRLLGTVGFTQVLVSPLQRARRTCELAGFAPFARVEPALSEWNYGEYEGQTPSAIRAQRPGWNVFQDGCPGGESTDAVCARADALLARLAPLEGTVALFSHGHFLRALAARWIGLPLLWGRHLSLDPGSLSILAHDPREPAVRMLSRWNLCWNDRFEPTTGSP